MSVRTPAIVASALLCATIGVHASSASAATARIDPVYESAGTGFSNVRVALAAGDDCRYRVVEGLYPAAPGSPAYPVWLSRVTLLNGCLGTQYEDGSILDISGIRVPVSILPRGKTFLGVTIQTRTFGGRWVMHRYFRSFWHR